MFNREDHTVKDAYLLNVIDNFDSIEGFCNIGLTQSQKVLLEAKHYYMWRRGDGLYVVAKNTEGLEKGKDVYQRSGHSKICSCADKSKHM